MNSPLAYKNLSSSDSSGCWRPGRTRSAADAPRLVFNGPVAAAADT